MAAHREPCLIPIKRIHDRRGVLSVLDSPDMPFACRRLYWIDRAQPDAVRGNHGHHDLEQVIMAVQGTFTLDVWNDDSRFRYSCDSFSMGVYIPPGYWRALREFRESAIALVAASLPFDPDDYVFTSPSPKNPTR